MLTTNLLEGITLAGASNLFPKISGNLIRIEPSYEKGESLALFSLLSFEENWNKG
jgi:hypothetical protein